MPQPAANYRHVHALRDKRNGGRMSIRVRGDSLAGQGWNLLGGRCHVTLQLEANAGSSKRVSIPVHEDGFVFHARLSFQQRLQQLDGLRPERADAFLLPLAEQANVEGRFQAKVARCEVQGLLNARSGVVKEALNLTPRDLRLESPFHVRLFSKG